MLVQIVMELQQYLDGLVSDGAGWVSVGPIRGPQGIQGIQGVAGNDGADGADGAIGPQGIQGVAGNDGADGAIGPQGIQGVAGNDGADGADGPQGLPGTDGNVLEPWFGIDDNTGATSNTEDMYVMSNWVGIGSSTGQTVNGELLHVNGAILTAVSIYPDYVFEDYFTGKSILNDDYNFLTLNEVEAYIKENNHLPGVTGISEVTKTEDGYSYNISELTIQSLEKVEELYLYTIEQQKTIDKLKQENTTLKARLAKIEAALEIKQHIPTKLFRGQLIICIK